MQYMLYVDENICMIKMIQITSLDAVMWDPDKTDFTF